MIATARRRQWLPDGFQAVYHAMQTAGFNINAVIEGPVRVPLLE